MARHDQAFSTGNFWPRGKHSEDSRRVFTDLLRRVTPGPTSGRVRTAAGYAGFDSWGNEAPEGLALPDQLPDGATRMTNQQPVAPSLKQRFADWIDARTAQGDRNLRRAVDHR